jgi:Domain of unknown function (DUF6919)
MSQEDAVRWQSARTLADLGALTADWLGGKIGSLPAYSAECGPDEETADLIPVLAAVNRAGFMTKFSQPGEAPAIGYDGAVWEQRATVSGFASDNTLQLLRAATRDTGLYFTARKAVTAVPVSYRDAITVTCRDEQPNTWCGPVLSRGQITVEYGDICHPDAVTALADAWQVAITDPQWGRNDHLWPILERFADTKNRR